MKSCFLRFYVCLSKTTRYEEWNNIIMERLHLVLRQYYLEIVVGQILFYSCLNRITSYVCVMYECDVWLRDDIQKDKQTECFICPKLRNPFVLEQQ